MTRMLVPLVRRVVRATHAWPGPKHLYRALYHRAGKAVGRLADTTGSIAGIYARNSYALGTWTPGLSDIDLTVVWRHPSAADLTTFHDQFDRLRRTFPMIGEVEMIEERHVGAWSSRGFAGFQSSSWRKLGGNHELQVRYLSDERVDRVRHATAIYRYNLTPLFASGNEGWAFGRFAAKLFRLFDKPAPQTENDGDVMAACLRELSNQIAALPDTDESDSVACYPLVVARPAVLSALRPGNSSCVGLLGRGSDAVVRYVLVSPDVASISRGNAPQITMDATVFRFYLCFVDPLEYVALARDRTVFFGPDPIAAPARISLATFRESVRHYAVQMLTCPYRREFGYTSDAEFRDLLYGWFLRTLRFLEDGEMTFEYHVLRDYFGKRHVEGPPDKRCGLLLGICDDLVRHLLVSETHRQPMATRQRM